MRVNDVRQNERASRITVLMLCVILLGPVPICAQGNPDQPLKARDVYFGSYTDVNSSYIHFRSDGTYTRIAREHMFTEESDRGTWSQDENEMISMRSEMHVRPIEAGSLTVHLMNFNPQVEQQRIDDLPYLIADIKEYLATRTRMAFPPEEIEKIRVINDLNVISADAGFPVDRGTLEDLIENIQDFIASEDKNLFRVTPMKHKDTTFLLWHNSEIPLNRNLERIKAAIDAAKPGEVPNFIYVSIDEKTFDEETSKTQPFIHYPKMNEMMGNTPENNEGEDTQNHNPPDRIPVHSKSEIYNKDYPFWGD